MSFRKNLEPEDVLISSFQVNKTFTFTDADSGSGVYGFSITKGDETTLNEINNFASSISTKVVNNDIKRLKSLDTSIPISDAHIQDTLRIMNDTNLSIDDAEYLLSTYYDMPEQYRENVSLTTYHSVYGGKN